MIKVGDQFRPLTMLWYESGGESFCVVGDWTVVRLIPYRCQSLTINANRQPYAIVLRNGNHVITVKPTELREKFSKSKVSI